MDDDTAILDEVETTIERFGRVRSEIGRAIFGQEQVIEEALTTLLGGGHVLLVGVLVGLTNSSRLWASCSA